MDPARLSDRTLDWWINDMVHRGAGTEVSIRIALAAVTAGLRSTGQTDEALRAALASAQAWLDRDPGALERCVDAREALAGEGVLAQACTYLLRAVVEAEDPQHEVRRGARCTTYLAVYQARVAFEVQGGSADDWERAYRQAMAEQAGPAAAKLRPWKLASLARALNEATRKRTG